MNHGSKTQRNQAKSKAPVVRPRPLVHGPAMGAPAVQRVPGLGPPVIGPMPPDVALTLQQVLGNKAVRAMLNFEEEALDEGALQEEVGGEGEVAGGIVVMRFGENALEVIHNVRRKIDELKQGLPAGVDVAAEYDRSALIERAVIPWYWHIHDQPE